LFEVNEAAAIIHDVAHPDANIIFGNVVDESLGDLVRVTVIAAGFDRFEELEEPRRGGRPARTAGPASRPAVRPGQREPQRGEAGSEYLRESPEGPRSDPPLRGEGREDLPKVFPSSDDLDDERDVFAGSDDDIDLDDDFDVPSFLK
jgi:cell division protein FtsZ